MDYLAKKWKQLVAGTESMLTIGNTKQPTTLSELCRHPDASVKLPIKCVKVMLDNLDIDIKSSGDSSPETSSATSTNLAEYSISQSSSKVFGFNKSPPTPTRRSWMLCWQKKRLYRLKCSKLGTEMGNLVIARLQSSTVTMTWSMRLASVTLMSVCSVYFSQMLLTSSPSTPVNVCHSIFLFSFFLPTWPVSLCWPTHTKETGYTFEICIN